MTLHHVVDGPEGAPALVLSSSLGTTLAMWEPQIAALAGRFRIVRYDRRGHGRSPVVAGPATIDDLGGDLLELLDKLGLERVSFCGLSLGGLEGMWLAVNAPERVDRLALCCTAPAFAPRQGWIDRAAAVRAERRGARSRTPCSPAGSGPPSTTRARMSSRASARCSCETPRDGYAACCDALADVDLTPRLARSVRPTLVVTGSDDPVVTPAEGDALAAAISGCGHITVVEDAAHIANVEQPTAFTAAILRHLSDGRGERMSTDGRDEIHARGMEVRRAVLGDAHVDGAIERTTTVHRGLPGPDHPLRLG